MVIHTIILSLGSNCNNGEELIKRASDVLKAWFYECKFSKTLKNPDVNNSINAEDYYNMLAEVKTSFPYNTVITMMKTLEKYIGNEKALRNEGIVVMDIDVVEFDREIIKLHDYERDYYKSLRYEINQR